MRYVLWKSISERYKRVAIHAKMIFGHVRHVLWKPITCTERYKRVDAHGKLLFGSLSMTLSKRQLITQRYKRVAAYGNSEFQIGSSPPQAEFFGRFYGSRKMVLLDFDTIWHLELWFWDPKSSKFSPAAPIP